MALENPSNSISLQNLSICDNENSVLFKTGSEWTRLSKPRQGEIIVRVTVTLCLIGLGILTVLSIIAYMKISVDVKELQDSLKSVNGLSTRQGNDLQLGDHINQMQTLMDALNMSTLSELQNLKEEAVTVLDNIQTMQDSLSRVGLNVQTLKEADKQFSQVQEQNSNSIQLFKDSVSLQLQQVMSLVANLSGKIEKLEELNSTLMSMLEPKDRNHCPEHFMLYGDKCYLFSLIADTFPNAKRECQLTQSYLMVIHNEAEQKFIADRLGSNLYWIGLTDSVKEGDWRWEDGTSYSSTPKFWKSGQPDNFQDSEHCAHLFDDGLWNDNTCTMQYKYICQKLPD
ncbi:hepatic lectin-like isoform X2 [Amblyraja radiata]|uniref:hepatic lectin-like isoform X2 n=1 Tax=Amblyraja radiata TaxID=386614 RepID=UPI001403D287|nr:hepatic lectin-like isoform X2 [Amblyraja radiata]